MASGSTSLKRSCRGYRSYNLVRITLGLGCRSMVELLEKDNGGTVTRNQSAEMSYAGIEEHLRVQ